MTGRTEDDLEAKARVGRIQVRPGLRRPFGMTA